MRGIWLAKPIGTKPGALLPRDWIFRLRTTHAYKSLLWAVKRHVAPFLFALIFLYLGIALANHFIFTIADAFGVFCRPKADSVDLMPDERRSSTFDTASLCAASGFKLEGNERYRITVRKDPNPWRDGGIETSTGGFHITELPWWRQPLMLAALPLKRTLIRPWFRVIARIGATGNDEEFLDPRVPPAADGMLQEVIRARHSGELFFYVNDAPLSIPGLTDYFYRDNRGTAEITVHRLPRPIAPE